MARVRLNQPADLPQSHRWLLERLEKRGGLLNIFRAMSHSPEALLRFMRFGNYFLEDGKVDPKLRELAILRAGFLCRAPYEVSQHIAFGRRTGLTAPHTPPTAHPPPALSHTREGPGLTCAPPPTADARVTDAAFDALRAFMDDEQIVELTMVTGFYNMVSRILNTLEVDVDPPAAKDLAELGVSI